MTDLLGLMTNEYALRSKSGHRISRGRILERFRLAMMSVQDRRRRGQITEAKRLAADARNEAFKLLGVSWRWSAIMKHATAINRILDREEARHG